MNAELTIIAAAGGDSDYGLSGVGHQKRQPRDLTTCARIGKHFLITTASNPTKSFFRTKWNTRGWTFQEALLSRRRLVFTEEQMYFECHGMYCCESLNFPLECMHRKDKQGFKKSFCVDGLVGAFPKGIGRTNTEIIRRIEEYTKRILTNPDDTFKGMLGIFNAFERSRRSGTKVEHYLGIPILPPMTQALKRGEISKPIQGWTPTMGFFVGLCWDLESPVERRPGFPSWSWTGWQSPVSWGGSSVFRWPSIQIDHKVKLAFECTDGQILSWEDVQKSRIEATTQPQMSNIIRITSWTIKLRMVRRNGRRGSYRYVACLKLEDGGRLYLRFGIISKVRLKHGQTCVGIFLDHLSMENDYNATIMVLARKGDIYERIGLARPMKFTYERYDRNGKADGLHSQSGSEDYEMFDSDTNPPTIKKSWKEIRLG